MLFINADYYLHKQAVIYLKLGLNYFVKILVDL